MPKRTDSNQSSIVAALRAFGASVADTHMVGHGYPDLSCGYGGRNYLFEVKSEHGKLNQAEIDFHSEWRGIIHVIYTIEDALSILCNGVEDDKL